MSDSLPGQHFDFVLKLGNLAPLFCRFAHEFIKRTLGLGARTLKSIVAFGVAIPISGGSQRDCSADGCRVKAHIDLASVSGESSVPYAQDFAFVFNQIEPHVSMLSVW